MTTWQLVWRGVTYFWRTNLAVVLGVATAVAVLAGALLVGHSVRASLADLVTRRLGATDAVIASPMYFREQLAADLAAHARFGERYRAAAPLIVADGVVTVQDSGRRAGRVKVYGVDDRFWRFHGVEPPAVADREAAISAALARELDVQTGTAVLVRVQRPSDIPLESLHSRKDDVGRTLRLTTRQVLSAEMLGEFSLDAQQGDVYAVFIPLGRLQTELEVGPRVNTVLLAAPAGAMPGAPAATERGSDPLARSMLREVLAPQDVGLSVRLSDDGRETIVGSAAGLVDDRQTVAMAAVSLSGVVRREVFTYLANTLRTTTRDIPYSLVAGVDLAPLQLAATDTNRPAGANVPPGAATDGREPIVLNTWAAEQLAAHVGDAVSLDYYVWEDPGQLVTRSAEFAVAGIVPLAAGGRDLAPDYPGISDATNLRDWDPPFPLDLRRVRPVDEAYWEQHRTTPKAFVSIAAAKRLWGSRYGSLTSVRLTPPDGQTAAALAADVVTGLRAAITPDSFGLVARDVRQDNLAASRGATDFGEYFVYFSFFLVVSALVLVVLFFKLGIEQRAREVGLLRAVGVTPGAIRRLFATEGLMLAVIGSLLGMTGALGYAAALVWALTTWWVDAVGTTELRLHVSLPLLLAGGVGGVLAAVVCIWWTLRGLRHVSERSLLAGNLAATVEADDAPSRRAAASATILAVVGIILVGLSAAGLVPPAAGFFGAGAALLVAALTFAGVVLRRPARWPITGHGWTALAHLAVRQSTHRPGRTVLTMAVLASATFILVSVDAFRREGAAGGDAPRSGTGGYELLVRTLLPIVHDPATAAGREELNLFALDDRTRIEPLRVRPGDDASCLNLYQPTNPRIAAPRDAFIREGRFTFQSSAATTDDERANPWLLLTRRQPDGAIPVIADANSMTYVLHRGVGDTLVIPGSGNDAGTVTLRFVAALQDSIFQSEVLMSTDNFRRLFPDQAGYQMLLVDTTAERASISDDLENGLADAEADAVDASAYLASFHRVENTYLSTFQTLGGLGLLLGTIGLATVLLRNVLERRRELGLLAAVGYRRSHFVLMAAAENLLIVVGGLALGAGCAALAIAPAVAGRGRPLLLSADVLIMLAAVFVVAMASSISAMAAAARSPLLTALRSE